VPTFNKLRERVDELLHHGNHSQDQRSH
jgi:hypothetical protein